MLVLRRRVRGLCKLFVGPVGAITRIHQDNHNAHAWLCNIRGRKLYVLCSPETPRTKVCHPKGQAGGSTYAGRLDPLDPLAMQRAQQNGVQIYATVLEPGQTILAPDGWWHYAVSLTPTITLMNNFWDATNLFGLEARCCPCDPFFRCASQARHTCSYTRGVRPAGHLLKSDRTGPRLCQDCRWCRPHCAPGHPAD